MPALTDEEFDRRVGFGQRSRAAHHWTPVAVIERACAMFGDARTILDVGSGIGKLCLVGAQLLPAARFVGIERDPAAVCTAQRLARELGVVDRTTFLVGDALDHAWDYDAIYLFNPFAEARLQPSRRAGHALEISRASERLRTLGVATRLVTFHGAGFELPAELSLIACEDHLCAWSR